MGRMIPSRTQVAITPPQATNTASSELDSSDFMSRSLVQSLSANPTPLSCAQPYDPGVSGTGNVIAPGGKVELLHFPSAPSGSPLCLILNSSSPPGIPLEARQNTLQERTWWGGNNQGTVKKKKKK